MATKDAKKADHDDAEDQATAAFGEGPETSGVLSSAGQASGATVDAAGPQAADREDAEAQAAADAVTTPDKLSEDELWIEVLVLLRDTLGHDKPNFREKADALIESLGAPART